MANFKNFCEFIEKANEKCKFLPKCNLLANVLIFVIFIVLLSIFVKSWPVGISLGILALISIFFLRIKDFLIVFTISFAVIGIFNQIDVIKLQNENLKRQIEQFEVNKRPYLFVEFKEIVAPELRDGELFFGYSKVDIVNTGEYPADIQTRGFQFFGCSDVEGDRDDFRKWYADTYGGFPQTRCLPSKEKTEPLPLIIGFSPSAKFVAFGIGFEYVGLSGKKYWYVRQDVYRLEKDDNGKIVPRWLDTITDWDKNLNKNKPILGIPKWDKYLNKQQKDKRLPIFSGSRLSPG